MPETLPKIEISDATPIHTSQLREGSEFAIADPGRELPDVVLTSAPADPLDRPHANASRIGISDTSGQMVGAFNLFQGGERSWINGANIDPDRKGERLAVSSYVGVLAALNAVGRQLESDPGGLSEDSTHVWESLARRGLAQIVDGVADQHGYPRFRSINPEAP